MIEGATRPRLRSNFPRPPHDASVHSQSDLGATARHPGPGRGDSGHHGSRYGRTDEASGKSSAELNGVTRNARPRQFFQYTESGLDQDAAISTGAHFAVFTSGKRPGDRLDPAGGFSGVPPGEVQAVQGRVGGSMPWVNQRLCCLTETRYLRGAALPDRSAARDRSLWCSAPMTSRRQAVGGCSPPLAVEAGHPWPDGGRSASVIAHRISGRIRQVCSSRSHACRRRRPTGV